MINRLLDNLYSVSLGSKNGRFLSDKSYGYDTIFFISKFILYNSNGKVFNKQALKIKAISYIEDIFNLTPGTAGAVNYFLEAINLLEFGNIIKKQNNSEYKIIRLDILEYICGCPENAYIFIYLLTYKSFENDGLLEIYIRYCNEDNKEKRYDIVLEIYKKFKEKSISVGSVDSNWSKQLVKYSFIILGYINKQKYIARTFKEGERLITVEDISLNVSGTRTPEHLPKKNDYIQSFSRDYILVKLKDHLIVASDFDISKNFVVHSLASDLADLKLDIIGVVDQSPEIFTKKQYSDFENMVKKRNPAIQNVFRKGLFDNNKCQCSICGFKFKKFLIAGHIKPYAVCEDTYDAVNHYNGLLLCPNHDKLFEGARYMTIEKDSGKIILNDIAKEAKEFAFLEGVVVDKSLIFSERRHYLDWHNKQFFQNNRFRATQN